jgi:hypothetical protein
MNDNQVNNASHIAFLITKGIREKLTMEEKSELDTWIHADRQNLRLYRELTDNPALYASIEEMNTYNSSLAWERFRHKLSAPAPPPGNTPGRIWLYIAALLALIAGAIVLYYVL